MTANDMMIGPGGVRVHRAIWVVEATIEAVTPIHLGSGNEGTFVDLELVRDAMDGSPLLTGDSLAGGLRDYLCDCAYGYWRREPTVEPGAHPWRIQPVFGGTRGDPNGVQSAVIAYDARGTSKGVELRDGVRIDRVSGVADDGGKFDFEVWAPGTSFDLRADLFVPLPASGVTGSGILAEEIAMATSLAWALDGVHEGHVRLGARTSRGFGLCRLAGVRARRFALDTQADWFAWLAARGERILAGAAGLDTAHVALRSQLSKLEANMFDAQREQLVAANKRRELVISAPVTFPSGILIGAPPDDSRSHADVQHRKSGGKNIVTGTGIAGALDKRSWRIAHEVRGVKGDAERLHHALFGSVSGRSRLTVEEVPLSLENGSKELLVTRRKEDQLTQATVNGALFQEQLPFGGATTLAFRYRLPATDDDESKAIAGLLLHAIRDMLLGEVPIGGTVNAGRGTVVPSGPLTVSVDGKPMSPGTINEWGRMLRTIPATAAAAAPPTAEGTSNA